MSRLFGSFATVVAVLLLSSAAESRPLSAQTPTGAIEGTITDAGTGRNLVGARVLVAGTQLGGVTNESGTFRIAGIPVRQIELNVRLIGYAPQNRSIVMRAG